MQLKLLPSLVMQPLLKQAFHWLWVQLCWMGLWGWYQVGAAMMHLRWASLSSKRKEDRISAFSMMISIAFG